MLSSLMSLWLMRLACRYLTAEASWRSTVLANLTLAFRVWAAGRSANWRLKEANRLPPLMSSVTRKTCLESEKQSTNLRMFGWSSLSRTDNSCLIDSSLVRVSWLFR